MSEEFKEMLINDVASDLIKYYFIVKELAITLASAVVNAYDVDYDAFSVKERRELLLAKVEELYPMLIG